MDGTRSGLRPFRSLALLAAAIAGSSATDAATLDGGTATPNAPMARPGSPATKITRSSLQVSLGYTKIDVDVFLPLANARGGLVPMTVKYSGPGPVASVQFPGSASLPLARAGSFDETVPNMDIRAILKRDEAAILDRCKGTLGANAASNVIDTVHDTQIAVTANGPDGAVFASTTVPYQLGLTCRNPLSVTIPYTKIEVDIASALSHAKGGLVSMAVRYDGDGNVASLQIPDSLGMPLLHQGRFEQTIPNMDIRAILKRDEAAIVERCRGTLQHNNTNRIDTSHDSRIPLTVNGPDGRVLGSTMVTYQLGLTCTR